MRIGLDSGLSEEEITRIHEGSAAEGWTEGERAILDATDELIADAFGRLEGEIPINRFEEMRHLARLGHES